MSPTPGHDELQEMLPAAALQILEPAELEQVLAHVRICRDCTKLLQEYREATAAFWLQLSPRQLDPARSRAVRARLMARARTDQSVQPVDRDFAAQLPSSGRATTLIYRWSGWMVAAGLAGVLLVHHSVHRPLDHGWLAAGVLVVLLIGLGIYARVQRSRVAELEDRQGAPAGRGSAQPGHDLTPA